MLLQSLSINSLKYDGLSQQRTLLIQFPMQYVLISCDDILKGVTDDGVFTSSETLKGVPFGATIKAG